MSDIIERLHGPDGIEAAREIIRLREENARLREALEGLQEIFARKYEIGTEVEVGKDD